MKTWIKNNKVCFVLILIGVLVWLGALFNWVIYPDSCYLKAIPLEAYDDEGNPDTTSVYSMENVCERHRFTEELLLEYLNNEQEFKEMQN